MGRSYEKTTSPFCKLRTGHRLAIRLSARPGNVSRQERTHCVRAGAGHLHDESGWERCPAVDYFHRRQCCLLGKLVGGWKTAGFFTISSPGRFRATLADECRWQQSASAAERPWIRQRSTEFFARRQPRYLFEVWAAGRRVPVCDLSS